MALLPRDVSENASGQPYDIVVNPTKAQLANSTLQLTVAGTKDGILMIEGFANFVAEEVCHACI